MQSTQHRKNSWRGTQAVKAQIAGKANKNFFLRHRKFSPLLQLPHTLLGLPPLCFSSANTDTWGLKILGDKLPILLSLGYNHGVRSGGWALPHTAGLHIWWFMQGLGFGKQHPVKAACRPEKCMWSCPADPPCNGSLGLHPGLPTHSSCHFCPAIWCNLADFTQFYPEASHFLVLHHRGDVNPVLLRNTFKCSRSHFILIKVSQLWPNSVVCVCSTPVLMPSQHIYH